MSQLIIVIRAGGTGTRLWPVSTPEIPKQFVPVLSERSLLQETFLRVRDFGVENIFVTTNAHHVALVEEQLPELPRDHIIAEPLKRNTGPAMAYETAAFAAAMELDDPVIASIPADDFVGEPEKFVYAVKNIAQFLNKNPEQILMPLVTPSKADVGFTYVRADFVDKGPIGQVTDWVEKPDQETCAAMVASGQWFAHTGMYFWKLSGAIKMFETYAPDVWQLARSVLEAVSAGDSEAALERAAAMPIISIESLVTKRYPNKTGYKADSWCWSDVGKWSVVKKLLQADAQDNTTKTKQVHFVNAKNNLVYGLPNKKVVCVGVNDLVIIDSGEHLLICPIEQAHEIGSISEQLKDL